jgi:hypothetical protein
LGPRRSRASAARSGLISSTAAPQRDERVPVASSASRPDRGPEVRGDPASDDEEYSTFRRGTSTGTQAENEVKLQISSGVSSLAGWDPTSLPAKLPTDTDAPRAKHDAPIPVEDIPSGPPAREVELWYWKGRTWESLDRSRRVIQATPVIGLRTRQSLLIQPHRPALAAQCRAIEGN